MRLIVIVVLLCATAAQAQPARRMNQSDVVGALGFTPLSQSSIDAPNGVLGLDANAGASLGGTGLTPTVRLNGTGAGRGLQWQNNGVARFSLQTDASDNLCLYAYGDGGAYMNAPVCFNRDAQTMNYNGQAVFTSAPAAGGPDSNGLGPIFSTVNNGTVTGAIGFTNQYTSHADAPNFDVGEESISVFDVGTWNPNQLSAGANATGPAQYDNFRVAVSPNDQVHNFGIAVAEWDIVNRGRDTGFQRDRSHQPVTGVLLAVPETNSYDPTTGGEGKSATYAFSVSASGGNNSTGFPAKFHTAYLCEPNSEAGVDGRCIYATGDITGTPSQYPYAPLQVDGTWLHGLDTTLATFGDGVAVHLAAGQMVGIGSATIGAGAGANGNLVLAAGGAGFVQSTSVTEIGANAASAAALLLNGTINTPRSLSIQAAGVTQWQIGGSSISDYAVARFSAGSYVDTPLAVSLATGLVTLADGLTLTGGQISAPLATPASSSAACTTGAREADANYVYVCVATNTWKRAALSSF